MKLVEDTLWHCLAAIAILLVMSLAGSSPFQSALSASIVLYVREATQEQCKRHGCQVDNDSWLPTTWSWEKNVEAFVPVAFIFGMAWLMSLFPK